MSTSTLRSSSRVVTRTLHRRYHAYAYGHRAFATVGPKTILGTPPKVPVPGRPLESGALPNSNPNANPDITPGSELQVPEVPPSTDPLVPTSTLNKHIFAALSSRSGAADLPALVSQYVDRHGRVLESSLAYESRPGQGRRVHFDQDVSLDKLEGGSNDLDLERSVVMVVHALQRGGESKVTVCSGFALNVSDDSGLEEGKEMLVLSCAHTFEEVRTIPLLKCIARNAELSFVPFRFVILVQQRRYCPPRHCQMQT